VAAHDGLITKKPNQEGARKVKVDKLKEDLKAMAGM
jgi:hypothetical protein